jgi:hypothetical protein
VFRHAQGCSPSAQVKAAAAQVQTLKRNEREKKVEFDLSGSRSDLKPLGDNHNPMLTSEKDLSDSF